MVSNWNLIIKLINLSIKQIFFSETSIGNENFPNTNLFDPGLSTSLNNHATSGK